MILALLAYWALSLNHLDALPMVREDEPWQTAPGYSLWTRGIYGSELFADFAHMNERYYLFQPTFSILLGLAARLWGLGLFQVRVVPVALGALTLCLTFAIGARLAGRGVGIAAVLLELLWRWKVSTPILASGIPLLDESRIARYDTLVPVFGLAGLYIFMSARRSRDFFLAGIFAGLAGLAHLYGLLWLPILALILFWKLRLNIFREPPLYQIAAGAFVAWLPWLIYVLSGFDDFVAQTANYSYRFDLMNPNFYLNNLIHEPPRYGLGRTTIQRALLQPGVWLLILGLPTALVLLLRHFRAGAQRELISLLIPAVLFPSAFGLLLWQKIPGYLLSVLPLFALVIACAGVLVWTDGARRPVLRALLLICATAVALDGVGGMIQQQHAAAENTPYHTIAARLREIVPRSGRVLALHQYWFELAENDFRSFTEVVFLTFEQYSPRPQTTFDALELVAPDIFILDPILGNVIARGDADEESLRGVASDYYAFMDRHHARELGRVEDKTYGTLIVYALSR
jgi:4-amino-4-deoxy-L-arabinose transferase-like glycosyltransferase